MPRVGCFWFQWMAKTQGSRDSQAMICPPVERRDGTPLSANGGVCWDWAELSLWAFRTFLTDLIHLEIKPVFLPLNGSVSTGLFFFFFLKMTIWSLFNSISRPWILMTGPSLYWLQMSQRFKQTEGCWSGKGLKFDFGQDVACAAGFHSHKGKTIICQSASSVRWTICLRAHWKV